MRLGDYNAGAFVYNNSNKSFTIALVFNTEPQTRCQDWPQQDLTKRKSTMTCPS